MSADVTLTEAERSAVRSVKIGGYSTLYRAVERIVAARVQQAEAERDALREQVEALAARHYDEGTCEWSGRPHVCGGCGRDWPCEDRRAIDAALDGA